MGEQFRDPTTPRGGSNLARLVTGWHWFLSVSEASGSIFTLKSLRLEWYQRFVFLVAPGSVRSKSILVKRLVHEWLHTTRDNYIA